MYPETWACIDCGVNTAPGCVNQGEADQFQLSAVIRNDDGYEIYVDEWSEVYVVKPRVWQAAGMTRWSGCLCIGCLEKRLGRILTPADFVRSHPFASFPGTHRLLSRRDGFPR
jgi:hypothetical protein